MRDCRLAGSIWHSSRWWPYGLGRGVCSDCAMPSLHREALARPVFVAILLACSLVGLKQYQRAAYHRHYTSTYGQRTFWHNAAHGAGLSSAPSEELPMALCDDRNAVDLVLARMEERNPNLDRSQWNWQAALNSLGNHNEFNWNRYEDVARGIYFELWRSRPAQMAACYGYYKPHDIDRQIRLTADRIEDRAKTGAAHRLRFRPVPSTAHVRGRHLAGTARMLSSRALPFARAGRRDPDSLQPDSRDCLLPRDHDGFMLLSAEPDTRWLTGDLPDVLDPQEAQSAAGGPCSLISFRPRRLPFARGLFPLAGRAAPAVARTSVASRRRAGDLSWLPC